MRVLPAQEDVVWSLLRRIHAQAAAVRHGGGGGSGAAPSAAPHTEVDIGRAGFNTYTIAGTRGAGKTTALKLATAILPWLGRHGDKDDGLRSHKVAKEGRKNDELFLWSLPEEVREFLELSSSRADGRSDIRKLFTPHEGPGGDPIFGSVEMRTALVLPIIDPTQFEHERGTVVEQVIAHLNFAIDQKLGVKDPPVGVGAASWLVDEARSDADPGVAKLRECQASLRGEIGRGWTFAQDFGQKMLMDDSASFDEFVASRAARSVDAALRHKRWKELVDKVLDCFKARLLVICFDDCDLAPQHTVDVMDAVRIYLASERIAVILATDLGEMRHNLRVSRLEVLAKAAGTSDATGRAADKIALSSMVKRELEQADLFLDKVVPIANRLHLHLTPYLQGWGLLGPDADEPAFGEVDRDLLREGYQHVFSFLTARDVANIRRMVEARDLEIGVTQLLEVSSALANMDEQYAALLNLRRPINIFLAVDRDPFLKIAVTLASSNDDEEFDPVFYEEQRVWYQLAPDGAPKFNASTEHHFEQADLLRGTFLAFQIDRNLVLGRNRAARIQVYFAGLTGQRELPPPFTDDHGRLSSDQDALLADLEAFSDLPRNCRSLLSAARILADRPRPAGSTRAKADFVSSLLTSVSLATQPEPRAGRLPFRRLVEKATDGDRWRQELLFRLLGLTAAALGDGVRVLLEPSVTARVVRTRLTAIQAHADELSTLAVGLVKALDESFAAMSLIGDAALIAAGKLKLVWSPPDGDAIDGMRSLTGHDWTTAVCGFFAQVSGAAYPRRPAVAVRRGRQASDTFETRAAIDFLIASLGPLAILRYRFGVADVEPLAAAARSLWRQSLPDLPSGTMLPSEDAEQTPASALFTRAARSGRPDWSTFKGDALVDAAAFLSVPASLLKFVLERL